MAWWVWLLIGWPSSSLLVALVYAHFLKREETSDGLNWWKRRA